MITTMSLQLFAIRSKRSFGDRAYGLAPPEFNAFASQQTLPLILALEAYTPLGHIITLGLDHYVTGYSGGLDTIETLRKEVDRVGGFMILAHPFRHLFENRGNYTQNILFED
jgi:hypothetical protein